MITIAVFGSPLDQEAAALGARIRARGCEPWHIDLSRFPEQCDIAFTGAGVFVDGRPLAEIGAAYLRNRGVTMPPYLDYVKEQTVASAGQWRQCYPDFSRYVISEQQALAVRNSLLQALAAHCKVVNPVKKNDLHRLKTYLFSFLKRQGLPVPPLAAGTDKEGLKGFVDKEQEAGYRVVAKPLAGIYKTVAWEEAAWQAQDWNRRGAFYQRFIAGDTIRCYVIDGRVAAAAKIVHAGTVDSSVSQTGIEVLELPSAAERIATETARLLGLDFCGLDLMRERATGNFYLIDCNLSPMFVNFARASGIDIPGLLADYLIEASSGASSGASSECSTGKADRDAQVRALLREAKELLADRNTGNKGK